MRLLGFNLTNLEVKKNPDFDGKLEMKSNLSLTGVEKKHLDLIKQDAAKIGFAFSVSYGELGSLKFEGSMMWKLDKKSLKEVLDKWNTDNLDPEIRTPILNTVLQKVSLQALKIEEEMALPLHMRMPRVSVSTEEQPSK